MQQALSPSNFKQGVELAAKNARFDLVLSKSPLKRNEAKECVEALLSAQPAAERLSIVASRLKELPDETCKLLALRHLCLDGNSLEELPPSIGSLVALETLLVSRNKLELLPDSLLQLGALRTLDLAHNRLKRLPQPSDYIDLCRRTWARLERLVLSSNMFDAAPPHIQCCVALRSVALDDNNLVEFPTELIHCRQVRVCTSERVCLFIGCFFFLNISINVRS